MQLVEIVLSGERKRSDNAYGSDGAFASCKVAVHPGDVLEDVIRAARVVIEQALDASGIPGPKATPAAKTPATPEPATHNVTVRGTQPNDERIPQLKALGLVYSRNWSAWWADCSASDAERVAATARELGLTAEVKPLRKEDAS